ncbi:MAG: hypothetical protein ACI8S6_004309 [Myxococcota bacterium]|jgi:hypothetical protein
MSDDKQEAPPEEPAGRSRPSLRGFARRLLREGEPGPDGEPRRDDTSMTRDILIAAMATGDKARTEIVRLLAREVRGYLEALELHKDLNDLITNYSLEVHASVSLKPLRDDDDGELDAKVALKRKS